MPAIVFSALTPMRKVHAAAYTKWLYLVKEIRHYTYARRYYIHGNAPSARAREDANVWWCMQADIRKCEHIMRRANEIAEDAKS